MSITRAGELSLEGCELCRPPTLPSGFATTTLDIALSGFSFFITGNDIITRDSFRRTMLGAEVESFGSSLTGELATAGEDRKLVAGEPSPDACIDTGCCLKMAASEGDDIALLPEDDAVLPLETGDGERLEGVGDGVKKFGVVVEVGCCCWTRFKA